MTERHYDRRTVLGVGGAGVVGLGFLTLAGCSAASTGDPAARSAPDPGTAASGDTSSAASTGATSGGSAASGGTPLAALSAVPVGGSAAAKSKVGGDPVVVSQQAAGQVKAFSAICTHQGCTVKPSGGEFHCPCHGSTYNAFTGEVIQGPARAPLTAIPVRIVGDQIVAG